MKNYSMLYNAYIYTYIYIYNEQIIYCTVCIIYIKYNAQNIKIKVISICILATYISSYIAVYVYMCPLSRGCTIYRQPVFFLSAEFDAILYYTADTMTGFIGFVSFYTSDHHVHK